MKIQIRKGDFEITIEDNNSFVEYSSHKDRVIEMIEKATECALLFKDEEELEDEELENVELFSDEWVDHPFQEDAETAQIYKPSNYKKAMGKQ